MQQPMPKLSSYNSDVESKPENAFRTPIPLKTGIETDFPDGTKIAYDSGIASKQEKADLRWMDIRLKARLLLHEKETFSLHYPMPKPSSCGTDVESTQVKKHLTHFVLKIQIVTCDRFSERDFNTL